MPADTARLNLTHKQLESLLTVLAAAPLHPLRIRTREALRAGATAKGGFRAVLSGPHLEYLGTLTAERRAGRELHSKLQRAAAVAEKNRRTRGRASGPNPAAGSQTGRAPHRTGRVGR
jgi:hypothetical protein